MNTPERPLTKEEQMAHNAMRAFRDQGDNQRALTVAQDAVANGIAHPWIFQDAAHAAALVGQKDVALSFADRAIATSANRIRAHLCKAQVLVAFREYEAALKFFESFVRDNPDQTDAAKHLTNLQRTVSGLKSKQAKQAYGNKPLTSQEECDAVRRLVYEQQEWSLAPITVLINWYKSRREYDRARELLQDWVEKNPQNPDAYFTFGAYWASRSKPRRAYEMLVRGEQACGYNKNAAELMLSSLLLMEKHVEYDDLLEKLCREHPNEDVFLVLRGQRLMKKGETAAAVPSFAKATKLQPQNNEWRFKYLHACMVDAGADRTKLSKLREEFHKMPPAALLYDLKRAYLGAKFFYLLGDFYAMQRIILPALKRQQQLGSDNRPLAVLYMAAFTDEADEGLKIIRRMVPQCQLGRYIAEARRIRHDFAALNDNDPEELKAVTPGPKISPIYEEPTRVPVNRAAAKMITHRTRKND